MIVIDSIFLGCSIRFFLNLQYKKTIITNKLIPPNKIHNQRFIAEEMCIIKEISEAGSPIRRTLNV